MKRAYDLGPVNPDARGDQRLYRLEPPMEGYGGYKKPNPLHEYVVVSALVAAFDTGRPETYIFPSDQHGKVTDFMEIGASQRDTTDHEKVLNDSGYTVILVEE